MCIIGKRSIVSCLFLLITVVKPSKSQENDENCRVPEVDLLVVLDGTIDVGTVNFGKMKNFVHQFMNKMDIGLQKSRVGVVQFTPTARPEFYPLNYLSNSLVQKAVNEIPYKPCIGDRRVCFGASNDISSLNYVAQFGMSPAAGNRPRIPDAMVVITSEGYRPQTYRVNETLFEPLSALYAFIMRIGPSNQPLNLHIPFATKTIEMHASSYDNLKDLADQLCALMTDYIRGTNVPGGDPNVARAAAGGSMTWLLFLLLFIIAIIVLILLGWLLCRTNKENQELKQHQEVQDEYDRWAATRSDEQQVHAAGYAGTINGHPHRLNQKGAGQRSVVNGGYGYGRKMRDQNTQYSGTEDGTTMTDFDLDEETSSDARRRHVTHAQTHTTNDGGAQSKHKHRHYHIHASSNRHQRSKTHPGGRGNGAVANASDERRDSNASLLHRSNSDLNTNASYANTGYEDDVTATHKPSTPYPKEEDRQSKATVNMGQGHTVGNKTSDYSSEHGSTDLTALTKPEMTDQGIDGSQDETSLIGDEIVLAPSAMGYRSVIPGNKSRIAMISRIDDQQENVHPSKRLPPVDLMLMVDNSRSIGNVNFDKYKEFLCHLIDNVNVGPGRSRIACVTFSDAPDLYFSFDQYFTAEAIKNAIKRMPYAGRTTFLGRALQFAGGILAQEKTVYAPAGPQNGNGNNGGNTTNRSPRKKHKEHRDKGSKSKEDTSKRDKSKDAKGSPKKKSKRRDPPAQQDPITPRQANAMSVLGKRLQVVIITTDGYSEDSVENGSKALNQKIGARVAVVGLRVFRKDKLKEISGYEGSAFLIHDKEAVCNWLFRQQSIWLEVNGYDPVVYGNLPLGLDM